MSRSFDREDGHPWFGGTSTNPVGLSGINEPPSRFPDNLGPGGYDEDFDPPLENIYECPICLLGLREPLQTPCGHRFCRGCILRSIRDAGPKCPVDNEHLDEWQLNADNFAKREVLNHYVFCPRKQLYECSWKGRLSELENHFQDCPQYFMSCEKCGKENIPSNEMQDHNKKECPRAELKCPFIVVGCPFEGPRTAVNEHVREQMVSHLTDLTKEIGALKFEQTGLQAQTQASQPARLDYLERFCQRLQREMVDLRSFAIGNGAELRRRPNGAEIDTLKAQVENLQRQMQELTARFNRQETKASEFEGTEFRQHISESLAKPNRSAFQRPIVPRNYSGYGYMKFVPIGHIRDRQYIININMLVRIQIDH